MHAHTTTANHTYTDAEVGRTYNTNIVGNSSFKSDLHAGLHVYFNGKRNYCDML